MVDEDEEVNVQGVFISNRDLDAMQAALRQIGNLIWKGIKDRLNTVLMRPWEAFANKEHRVEVSLLKEQIDCLKEENRKLHEKQVPINVQPLQTKGYSDKLTACCADKMLWDTPLDALKDYWNQDDVLSVESGKSFKFQCEVEGTSTFNTEKTMELTVSKMNAEEQLDALVDRIGQEQSGATKSAHEEFLPVESYFAIDKGQQRSKEADEKGKGIQNVAEEHADNSQKLFF